jgi:hypothetical protein
MKPANKKGPSTIPQSINDRSGDQSSTTSKPYRQKKPTKRNERRLPEKP